MLNILSNSKPKKLSIRSIFEQGFVIFARVDFDDNHIVTFEDPESTASFSHDDTINPRSKTFVGNGKTFEQAFNNALYSFHYGNDVKAGNIRYPEQIQTIISDLEKWLSVNHNQLRAVHDDGDIFVRLESLYAKNNGTSQHAVMEGIGPTFFSAVSDAFAGKVYTTFDSSTADEQETTNAEVFSIYTSLDNYRP